MEVQGVVIVNSMRLIRAEFKLNFFPLLVVLVPYDFTDVYL